MPDDLKLKTPQDPRTISTQEEWEVQYWTKKFGVSKERLLQAIRAVGNQADAVKRHLGV